MAGDCFRLAVILIQCEASVVKVKQGRQWKILTQHAHHFESLVKLSGRPCSTPVLSNDGSDLAAALQIIIEIGDNITLSEAVEDVCLDSELSIIKSSDSRFAFEFHQAGLLRPLSGYELSGGTLRYLQWPD